METTEAEEVLQSETITKIIPALIKAQQTFRPALKESVNPHYKSRYCDLASCIDACKDALSANGLAVVQTTITVPRTKLVTSLYHESGQWIRSFYPLDPQKNDPQGLGSAVTYARRYNLMAIVGLAPEDDDGTGASQRPANNEQRSYQNGHSEPAADLPPMKRASDLPQPPPRSQPTEDTGRLPVHGSQFFAWMKDQEKKYEAPFHDKIKPWAKKLGWHWDTREWSDDQVSTAVKFVQDMIKRFDDQSPVQEPEDHSQEPVTPPANGAPKGPLQISKTDQLGPLKVDIASTVRQLCYQSFQRQATPEEIMQRIDAIAAEVYGGEIIGNLRECKDGRILIAVRDAAKHEHENCRAFGGSAA